jgi:hypothetical protein
MFPWWVRLFIFLPLAALQIILLTISALGWQYEVEFEQFMILLGDMVSSALQLNLIEAIIRDLLASWDIVLPELGKHWHHVFVLWWLLTMSFSRLIADVSSLVNRKLSTVGYIALFFFAGLSTLVSAISAGAMPLSSAANFFWPLSATSSVGAAFAALSGQWWQSLQLVAISAGTAVAGFIIGSSANGTYWIELLAFCVAALGFLLLIVGLKFAEGRNSRWQYLQNPAVASGLDILGPFAVAATLAWMFGKYMPV